MPRLPEMVAGDPALMRAWNELIRLVGPLLDGPQVAPPLTVKDGVIVLDDGAGLFTFRTTETITARSGDECGTGKGKLGTQRNGKLFAGDGAGAEVDLYNITGGEIDPDVYGICGIVDGEHYILVADCSGVE